MLVTYWTVRCFQKRSQECRNWRFWLKFYCHRWWRWAVCTDNGLVSFRYLWIFWNYLCWSPVIENMRATLLCARVRVCTRLQRMEECQPIYDMYCAWTEGFGGKLYFRTDKWKKNIWKKLKCKNWTSFFIISFCFLYYFSWVQDYYDVSDSSWTCKRRSFVELGRNYGFTLLIS